MLSAIRLPARKGLPELDLEGLGKVNVLCGKNNSGKSTILEALADRATALRGLPLTGTDRQALEKAFLESAGIEPVSYSHPIPTRMLQALARALETRPFWYKSDVNAVLAELREILSTDPNLHSLHWNRDHVKSGYQTLASWSYPETKLIPAKRELELIKGINLAEPVETRGTGILNFLFRAKNQLIGTGERDSYERVVSAFADISDGFAIGITPDTSNRLSLSFARPGKEHLPAADCGLGLQDLLIILFFAILHGEGFLLVEEPENHLHPEIQRRLLTYLRTHAAKQVFLATHSSVMLDNSLVDRVFFTSYIDRIVLDDATSRASILDNLGYSVTDNLVSDAIVLVEGPTDIPVLEHFVALLGITPKYNIRYWPLGGDIMQKLDLSIFAERHAIMALVDKDPGSKKARNAFIRECKRQSIEVHQLSRRAIENYFTVAALRAVFKGQVPDTFEVIDHNVSLRDQLGFEVKNNNQRVARAMTLQDIDRTDLWTFLDRLRHKCQSELPASPSQAA